MDDPTPLRRLLDLVPDAVFLTDAEGRYRYVNRAAAGFLDRTVNAVLGRTDDELLPESAAETVREHNEAVLAAGRSRRQQYSLNMPDGEVRAWEVNRVPVDEEEFGFDGVAGVARDVTDRRRAQRGLRRAKSKYEALFSLNPVSLVVIDAGEKRLIEVNRGFESLYGYPREEVAGKPLSELELFIDPERIGRIRERALRDGRVEGEFLQVRRRDGEVRDVLLSCVRISVEEDVYLVGTAQDVSPLRETERELRRRALHDSLTGLPNRDLLWDRCEQGLERCERTEAAVAVLYLDLNGFKSVNDTWGHAAGDDVLVEAAGRLADRLRGEDTVARVGGDEFVVLLEGLSGEPEARAVVERLLEAFDDPFAVPDGEVALDASCGGLLVSPEAAGRAVREAEIGERVEALIDRADRKMYAAKQSPGSSYRMARTG